MENKFLRVCGTCNIIRVPEEVCSLELVDPKEEDIEYSDEIGKTCRNELVIIHRNKEGKIIEIELAGGNKPCSEV